MNDVTRTSLPLLLIPAAALVLYLVQRRGFGARATRLRETAQAEQMWAVAVKKFDRLAAEVTGSGHTLGAREAHRLYADRLASGDSGAIAFADTYRTLDHVMTAPPSHGGDPYLAGRAQATVTNTVEWWELLCARWRREDAALHDAEGCGCPWH